MNEPVKSYAPGTPEREELRVRLAQMERDRITIPMVIGGKEVETKETTQAVMPHRKEHVLADVAKGGAQHVQQAIDAARDAHADWSRLPWEERASVFLRAAELLSGPWRSTIVAATMLNQSKTAHQAEIDAANARVAMAQASVEQAQAAYNLVRGDPEIGAMPQSQALRTATLSHNPVLAFKKQFVARRARRQAKLPAAGGPGALDGIAAGRLDIRDPARSQVHGIGHSIGRHLNGLSRDLRSRNPAHLRETGHGRPQQHGSNDRPCNYPPAHTSLP